MCGGVEKLSFRVDAGVGDVAGVGVVEVLSMPRFGAASKCRLGAELPICMPSDADDGLFTNVTEPAMLPALLVLVDGLTPAPTRAAL